MLDVSFSRWTEYQLRLSRAAISNHKCIAKQEWLPYRDGRSKEGALFAETQKYEFEFAFHWLLGITVERHHYASSFQHKVRVLTEVLGFSPSLCICSQTTQQEVNWEHQNCIYMYVSKLVVIFALFVRNIISQSFNVFFWLSFEDLHFVAPIVGIHYIGQ